MANILIATNSTYAGYGYSIVGKHVACGLRNAGHSVVVLGMQTLGAALKDDLGNINIPVGFDAWMSDVMEDYLRAYGTDILITIFDLWLANVSYIPAVVSRNQVKWIAHITINSDPLSSTIAEKIKYADVVVAPSRYNLRVLKEAGFGRKTVYIPHGVLTSVFQPFSDEMRRQLREIYGFDKDEFIFLTVGRNNGQQKNYYTLFAAFRRFINVTKAKARLLVLAEPTEPRGSDLLAVREHFNLDDEVEFIKAKPCCDYEKITFARESDEKAFYHKANFKFDEVEMAKIYNLADCFVTATLGESFGLPILESLACGTPVIMPDNSTAEELVKEGECGLVAECCARVPTPIITEVRLVSVDSLEKCMRRIYDMYRNDRKNYDKLCRNAVEHAEKYDWKYILPLWNALVDRVYETCFEVDFHAGKHGL